MKLVKRMTALALAGVMCLGLAACGERGKSKGNQSSDEPGVITIKIGHVEAEDRSTHQALVQYFKEPVEAKTNGAVKVEIHPNSALGGDAELTESVAMGSLDAALPSTSVLVTYDPKFGIMDMPWLFTEPENAFAAMDGEMGQYFNEKLETVGIHCLGYSYNGLRSMTNSARPITCPADLKGLKMRVMENPVFIDFFNTLGANATPMGFNELFTGLQQKTVDGQENPPSLMYATKFQEVQKYLSLTEHTNNFLGFIINKDFYDNKLNDEQRQIITEAAAEFVKQQRAMELADTDLYVKKLEEEHMEVNYLTEEQKEEFKTALAPMYEKYRGEFGDELFDIAEKYNK